MESEDTTGEFSGPVQSPIAAVRYKPLAVVNSSIRLLSLEPGAWDSDIKCYLSQASLDDELSFEAVSYTWGDATKLRQISLEDSTWNITMNLEIALRYLRLEDKPRILWIDALCINQEDIGEKAAQIPLMRKIYSSATHVLAWTGEPGEDSEGAFPMIEDMADTMEKLNGVIRPQDMIPEALREHGFDVAVKNWPSLWDFWSRPYFERVWVLQELAGHDEQCQIICGHSSVPKESFNSAWMMVLFLVKANHSRSTFEYEEPLLTVVRRGIATGMRMGQTLLQVDDSIPSPLENTIFYLLRLTNGFEASDPRDRVYALLGLCREEDRDFTIDYSITTKTMYENLVNFTIEREQKLHCLTQNRTEITTPSWRPPLDENTETGHGWENRNHIFHASADLKPIFKFTEDAHVLSIKGVKIGVAKEVIGPFRTKRDPNVEVTDIPSLLKSNGNESHLIGLKNCAADVPEERIELFWRTLVMDQDVRNWEDFVHPVPDSFAQGFRVWLGEAQLPEDFYPDLEFKYRYPMFIAGFGSNCDGAISDRCFFVMEDGQFGLGPSCMQPGDVAAVLFGGDMPFILRPKDENFLLCGDAYIHSAMKGANAEPFINDPSLEGDEFRLC